MDDKGQIYFGSEDEIPKEDVQRLTDAQAAFLLRTAADDFADRVERLRQAEALQNPTTIVRAQST